MEESIKLIRTVLSDKIAEDLISVQPMPNIDFKSLAKHPLWQSFVDRHTK